MYEPRELYWQMWLPDALYYSTPPASSPRRDHAALHPARVPQTSLFYLTFRSALVHDDSDPGRSYCAYRQSYKMIRQNTSTQLNYILSPSTSFTFALLARAFALVLVLDIFHHLMHRPLQLVLRSDWVEFNIRINLADSVAGYDLM